MRRIDHIFGAIPAIGRLDAPAVVEPAKNADDAARGFAV
jgi:hypothetical protein